MIPKEQNVGSQEDTGTWKSESSLADYSVEQSEDIVGFLVEDTGPFVAEDSGTFGMLAARY